MLTLLALVAQTATLGTPVADNAMKCGMASILVAASEKPQLRETSHFMYFVMQAAKAAPTDKPFVERVGELAGTAAQTVPIEPETSAATATACDRTYPMARTTVAPRLPANAFDRDVMCMGTLSMLKGAADEMSKDGTDAGAAKRIDAALASIAQRLDDAALAKRGMTTEGAFIVAMGDQLKASLAIGNPLTIARACGATGI